LSSEAPTYRTGVAVTLASFRANIVLFTLLYILYFRTNAARDREAENSEEVDVDREIVEAFSDLTDLEIRQCGINCNFNSRHKPIVLNADIVDIKDIRDLLRDKIYL
jgi:hypothetical protein